MNLCRMSPILYPIYDEKVEKTYPGVTSPYSFYMGVPPAGGGGLYPQTKCTVFTFVQLVSLSLVWYNRNYIRPNYGLGEGEHLINYPH